MSLREAAHDAPVRSAPSPLRSRSRPPPRPRPPIDLDHVDSQAPGIPGRRTEVLKLFLGQAAEGVSGIRSAAGLTERRIAAHALVVHARGAGAFSIAYIASEIELARGPITGRLIALERAVEAARYYIGDLLSE